MTHPVRVVLVGGIVLGVLAAGGCHSSAVTSPTPSVAVSTSTPTPTPTPSKTYGPNATAALTAVSAYFAWINTYSKDPSFPNFGELNRLAKRDALSVGLAAVNTLAFDGQHQVGDVVVVELVPDGESRSQIGVSACLDESKTSRVDKGGQTVPPLDSITRRAYTLKVEDQGGTWFVVSTLGGMTTC